MADFCQKCSIETWGKDMRDLAGLTTPEETAEGIYAIALCEGCGDVYVDHEGKAVELDPAPKGNVFLDLSVSIALTVLVMGGLWCAFYLIAQAFS